MQLRPRLLEALLFSLDVCYDETKARVITGSPRSGTTWLAGLIASSPGSVLIFEPLQLQHVREAHAIGFGWRTYVEPGAEWPAAEDFLRRVFQGRIRNAWTLRETRLSAAWRGRFVLAKFVRANRLLPWMTARFSIPPPLLLIRHPCAVVASQRRERAWASPPKPKLPGPLVDIGSLQKVVEGLETPEEYLAATWAIDNYLPLSAPGAHHWQVVSYERLVTN